VSPAALVLSACLASTATSAPRSAPAAPAQAEAPRNDISRAAAGDRAAAPAGALLLLSLLVPLPVPLALLLPAEADRPERAAPGSSHGPPGPDAPDVRRGEDRAAAGASRRDGAGEGRGAVEREARRRPPPSVRATAGRRASEVRAERGPARSTRPARRHGVRRAHEGGAVSRGGWRAEARLAEVTRDAAAPGRTVCLPARGSSGGEQPCHEAAGGAAPLRGARSAP
jgi:hypothetical protein